MGLFDFVKEAGASLFGGGQHKKAADAKAAGAAAAKVRSQADAMADKEKGVVLTKLVKNMGLEIDDLKVDFKDGHAVLEGSAPSQEVKEKVILMVGNTQGVARVDDRLKVEKPEPEATMYTVKSGDSLSKIAKEHYGNAMKYMLIFEANTPMLKDPNQIHPGQVLRIPPLKE